MSELIRCKKTEPVKRSFRLRRKRKPQNNRAIPEGELKTVANLQGGYLAVRTSPIFRIQTELSNCRLHNGDQVIVTGERVTGSGIQGLSAVYVKVYVPKKGVSGYVNAHFLA